MTTTRTVREDQHGTTTGYSYGCRCNSCRRAVAERNKAYRDQSGHQTSDSLRSRVLDILRREADLDDVAIVSGTEIGQELGISQPQASAAIRELGDDNLVRIEGRVKFDIPIVRLLGGAA